MLKNLFLLALVSFNCLLSAQTVHFVTPSDTDSNINIADDVHIAYINDEVNAQNKLFLFLPGTGAIPFFYKAVMKKAANLGYHSMGIAYPNELTINGLMVCGASADTTCHRRARHEIFDGIPRHDAIDVNPSNSIQNRVKKLLLHLSTTFPNENWSQYLADDESILWDKIILAGHSQGAGQAAFIAKIKIVNRVVLFAAMDWVFLLDRTADWVTAESATPIERYFGFIHDEDERIPYDKQLQVWEDLGLPVFGDPVLVDNTTSPYENVHILYTQITPAVNTSKFHSAIVVDLYTPKDENDIPVLAPVWEYLIDSPIISATENNTQQNPLAIFPNPTHGKIYIDLANNEFQNIHELQVFNTLGQLCLFKKNILTKKSIDLSILTPDLYIIQVKINQEVYIAKLMIQ